MPGDATPRDPSEGINTQIFDELSRTGAIRGGRRHLRAGGRLGRRSHDGVPIFIYSRHEPRIDISGWPLVTSVDDVETAMASAKHAAGERVVSVHGAAVGQLALPAGILDELELHVVPVLLGQGRRLFDGLGPEHIEYGRDAELGSAAACRTTDRTTCS